MTFRNALFLCGVFAVAGFLNGCSSTQEKPSVPILRSTEQELKEYKDAENTYKARKFPLALKKFSYFVQRHPHTDVTDRAAFYAGQIYYDSSDYFRAARFWLYVADAFPKSPFVDKSLVGSAVSLQKLGRTDEALSALNRFHVTETTDPVLAKQSLDLGSKLKQQKGDNLGALEDTVAELNYSTQAAEKTNLNNHAVELISTNMTQPQIEQALTKPALHNYELPLRFRLGQLLYDQKSQGSAKDQFKIVVAKYPDTEQAKSAQGYLNSLDAQQITDSSVIGVILPLSGKYAQMGYKTLRGIQMGMGFFNKSGGSSLKLAIIDSEGNADIARRGVERLVSEDHAVVIIGDILSKTATAVALKAQELGVPCLALAQRQDISEIGDFIFRNTLTPEMQMRSLVDLAMTTKGYKKFAILYPNDSYGTEYASLFWDNVRLRGGEITAAQSYQPNETDFRDSVQRLVGTYYAEEDRGKELSLRMTEWQKAQALANVPKSQRDKPPKDLLPPVVDFDALFIPDGPKAIGQIAPMLAYNDINNVPLLGTNLWDTPQIVARGTKFVENSIFVDDFFNDDPSPSMKAFSSEFKSLFNYVPDVFEAQGYDSALLIAQVLRANGSVSRTLLKDKLAQAVSPVGSTGPLKMTPQREVEKSLVPLTVQGSKIVKFETGRGALQ